MRPAPKLLLCALLACGTSYCDGFVAPVSGTAARQPARASSQFSAVNAPPTNASASHLPAELAQALALFKQATVPFEAAARFDSQSPADLELAAVLGSRLRGIFLLINKFYPAPSGSVAHPTTPALAELQQQMLPYMQHTRITKRFYQKPRGYAGDFLTIQWMYSNQPGGSSALGQALDRCFMEEPAALAVQNRRALLQQEIEKCLRRHPDRKVRVTSLACGPAAEVFDMLAQSALADRMELTLVDMDEGALAYVRARLACGFPDRAASVKLVRRNLVHVCVGREPLDLPPQDLMYSIGLIDYFSDRTVARLMAWIRGALAPRGTCVLGNFHTSNPTRGCMDALLDWRLVHRDEGDMARIAAAAGYPGPPTFIYEPAGVNMFASVTAGDGGAALTRSVTGSDVAGVASTIAVYTDSRGEDSL